MHIFHYIEWCLLALGLFGLLTSTVFLGMVFAGVTRLRRERQQERRQEVVSPVFLPAVSLFKPLHGAEPGLAENLRSFYEQDYLLPAIEIIFGARSEEDAGLAIARTVAAEYPNITTKFIASGEPWAPNAKVCSLVRMAQEASHDLWVVSDSDVQVGRDYLRRLVAPFADARVGCVSCLYRGVGQVGVWSRLEAAAMSIEMSSGVAVANMMEPMQFALGPTMAARRACVQEIGGFESLADFCADDFVLGNRIAAHGHTVALSSYTIDHIVLHAKFLDSIKHQVRWMKSTRFSRPKGHFGTGLTFATPFGLLVFAAALLLQRPWLGVAALAWSVVGRMLQAWVVGKYVVEERTLWQTVLLFPIRDLMGFFFWMLSYSSNRILWRGEIYELLAEGRMRKAK